METVIIKVEIKREDLSIIEAILKKFQAKSLKIEETDPARMTKEEYFGMIDEARKGKKKKMSREEMRKLLIE